MFTTLFFGLKSHCVTLAVLLTVIKCQLFFKISSWDWKKKSFVSNKLKHKNAYVVEHNRLQSQHIIND